MKGTYQLACNAVVVIACVLITFRTRAEEPHAGPLTIEATLGAAFMGSEDDGLLWNVYSRANSAALPQLRAILRDGDLVEHHANVLRLLGYIGTDEDREEIVKQNRKLTGELKVLEKVNLIATFDALALMARRGDKAALEVLRTWSSPGYWRSRKINWYSAEQRAAVTAAIAAGEIDKDALEKGETDLVLLRPLCYARALADDYTFLGELRTNAKGASTPSAATLMRALAAREKTFRQHAEDVRKKEQEQVPPRLRRSLPMLFNGDLGNPGKKDSIPIVPPSGSDQQ